MPTYHTGTPYRHTNFGNAAIMLASRLSDTNYQYWTKEEMGRRIVQALRVWQALTGSYRERAEFTADLGGDPCLNLHSVIPQRFGFTVKDQDVVKGIQYSLLEPATGNTWAGSSQFTLDAVSKALQRRRNQFLLDTGMVLSYSTLDVPPQPVGRVPLPDSVVDVRRVAWTDNDGTTFPVFRDDEFSALSFNPGWPQAPGAPQAYSAAITPPVSIQLVPPPSDKGKLELITVNTGPDLDPANGVLLSVPDDFTVALEFGALADLLSTDGLTRDSARAKYAESLYQLLANAAKVNPSVLMTQVNDEVLYTGSLFDLDTFMPDWENTPNTPSYSAMAGRNILALAPVPDKQYGVTVDFVPNIPVPVADGDYLQVGREHLEAVMDFAQHLCAFKQGGAEFMDTMPLLQNFLRIAGVQNARLSALAFYNTLLLQPALEFEKQVPRLANRSNQPTQKENSNA